jgi:dihydroorotate dehydrogenase
MYKLFRPLLFNISKDPETVHGIALSFLNIIGKPPLYKMVQSVCEVKSEALSQTVFGLDFANPVGLAGGFDKEAIAVLGLEALGFGFLEVGTVTRHPQLGNPRPRIVRLTQDEGLINRMGFNNHGADALAEKIVKLKNIQVPLGINLGKSRITELSDAESDYLYSFAKLYNIGSYFVVNISSPNTPGLRQLQDKNYLTGILKALMDFRNKQIIKKPILVKIVIDFTLDAVDDILQVCKTMAVDGIICSNTSLSREGLAEVTNETGGLSGKPIKLKSTAMVNHIHKHMPELPIVGVGGIFDAEDAYEKIKAGSSLVQVYTGFIYEGPLVAKKINQGLVNLLERDGFKNVSEAVGVENK